MIPFMNWFSSPLAATAVVCAILAALAIPLRSLTTHRVAVALPIAETSVTTADHGPGHVHAFSGVLRVRLLKAAESLKVSTTDGKVLWDAAHLAAGEHETDAEFLLIDDALELLVEADFGGVADDTALFITVLPDGVQEITHYAIGSGNIEDILSYEWDLHQ